MGEFTRRALAHYNTHHGIEPASNWYYVLKRSEEEVREVFVTYTIREEDAKFVNPSLSYDYASQANSEYLSYRRFSEFVSERFHCDEELLERINPGVDVSRLRVGDTLKVPNVTEFKIEDVPRHEKFSDDAALSSRHVIVDTTQRVAAIWETETGDLVASFPITPGREKFIHRGDWKLQSMVTTPEFRYDKSMLEQGVRSDDYHQLPPGPNSPVGIIWCGTSKSGIGLHGTASPHSIGRARSAGCIRLSNWDAIRLPNLVRPGAKVTIR
jgi:lipoprotein-anchoring transpeptidase ErfK/SrfK